MCRFASTYLALGVRKYSERAQEIMEVSNRLFEAGIVEKLKWREMMTKPKANVSH